MFIEKMSFQVTRDDMEGGVIIQLGRGGACFFYVAAAELLFSVLLEILRKRALYMLMTQ